MPYSANTIGVGVVSALTLLVCTINLAYAIRTTYRAHEEQRQKQHTAASPGRTKYPALLRATFLATVAAAFGMGPMATSYSAWLYVDDRVRLDPFTQTSEQQYSVASQFCEVACKAGTALYITSKLSSYLFLFLKQRTVRPMNEPVWQEKVIFLMTLGIIPFAVLDMLITQGEVNALDGTCQLYAPIWMLSVMAGADVTLSLGYLYLFISPLRETVRNNQHARSRAEAHALTATATSGGKSTATPAVNTALEDVMRKNTWACVITVCISFCSLSFMIIAHAVNDPYARKWVTPIGHADSLFTSLALVHIMRKPGSSKQVAPERVPAQMMTTTTAPGYVAQHSPTAGTNGANQTKGGGGPQDDCVHPILLGGRQLALFTASATASPVVPDGRLNENRVMSSSPLIHPGGLRATSSGGSPASPPHRTLLFNAVLVSPSMTLQASEALSDAAGDQEQQKHQHDADPPGMVAEDD